MALDCDCYGGCWADHSQDWPTISAPREDIERLYRLCFTVLPYGSYVKNGTELRIETPELLGRLIEQSVLGESPLLEAIRRARGGPAPVPKQSFA